jgi:hypothetical protein
MNQEDANAVAAWREAAADLDIRVEAPYAVAIPPDRHLDCIAYLPDFGSRRGMVIKSTAAPDDGLHEVLNSWASLSPDVYSVYERHSWIDRLEQWRWYGAGSPPAWYTAISPWHTDENVLRAVSDELSRIFGSAIPVERSGLYRELDLLPGEEVLAFLARVPTAGVTKHSFRRWIQDVAADWEQRHPRRLSHER